MTNKRRLAKRLAAVEGFAEPRVELEQYRTPPELAATLVHTADLQGDLEGTVVDLGCGTGMLALAAALRKPRTVGGLDVDARALETARENERRVDPARRVSWVLGDVTAAPLCRSTAGGRVTVLMNPPFGAQNEGADRAFLTVAATIADVSYSVHNAGSRAFVGAFSADHGGDLTHAFAADLAVPRTFDFHREASKSLDVEVFRIVWNGQTG